MLPAEVEITAGFPVVKGDTLANLEAAAAGEKFEWSELYLESEKIAREEGFQEVADAFRHIASVEAKHENRYRKLAENIRNGQVFKRDQVTRWKCSNCGYVHEGTSAPDICPACKHPKDYYELYVEAY